MMDWDFVLRAELTGYESLQITRSYYGTGGFELAISPRAPGAEEIGMGRVLFLSEAPYKAMLIDKVVWKGGRMSVSGKLVKGIAARRICMPPVVDDGHFGWDRFLGSAEAAYHHFAMANLIAPEDGKRRVERLEAAPNQNRGIVLPWQARFDALDGLLAAIGEATEVGWDIVPDHAGKRFVFRVDVGRDLTQGGNAVALSEEAMNAADVARTDDLSAHVTTAYVGGSGEDEERLILSEGNERAGVNRREAWVDGGSMDDIAMLRVAARRKLDGATEKHTLTAELLQTGLCQYERDYDVGDKLILLGQGSRSDTRLLEMKEVYENGTRTLNATFGDVPATMTGYLKGMALVIVR